MQHLFYVSDMFIRLMDHVSIVMLTVDTYHVVHKLLASGNINSEDLHVIKVTQGQVINYYNKNGLQSITLEKSRFLFTTWIWNH